KDTWSEQLERLLAARDPAHSASVVNTGVPGYSARQIRLRLEELLSTVRPNVVVYGMTTETYTRMHHPIVLYGGTLVRSDALPGLRIVEHGLLYSPYHRAWMREVDYWLNQHFQLGAHVLYRLQRAYQATTHDAGEPEDLHATAEPQQIQRDMQPALAELATMRRD